MRLDSLYKLYIHELKNLYSAEKQSLALLPALIEQVARPDLSQALQKQFEATQQQITKIDNIFNGLEFSPTGEKCRVVAGLIADATKAASDAHTHQISDHLIALAWLRLQNYSLSSYETAGAYAEQLGRVEDAVYLESNQREKRNSKNRFASLTAQTQHALESVAKEESVQPSGQSRLFARIRPILTKLSLRRGVKITLALLGFIVIIATVLSWFPLPFWWVRIFDFPRVQIAVLGAGVMLAYLVMLRRHWWPEIAFAVVLAGCIGHQAYSIHPYTILADWQVQPSASRNINARFQLMVANVLMENRNAEGLLKIVADEDPDLLLVVEADRWWVEQLSELQQRYPFFVRYPLDNTYGMALYSRLKLIDPQINFLIQDDVPSIHTRFALPSGVEIELHGLHPRPPSPTEHYRSTERDAELLLVGEVVKDAEHPVVVAGDMNDVAWSRTTKRFQRISQLLDPRIGRGIFGTFHADYPLLRWPLDHVFFSKELRLVDMQRLSYFGSDHFPISITLSYEPEHSQTQEEPENADSEDHEEARETINEAER